MFTFQLPADRRGHGRRAVHRARPDEEFSAAGYYDQDSRRTSGIQLQSIPLTNYANLGCVVEVWRYDARVLSPQRASIGGGRRPLQHARGRSQGWQVIVGEWEVAGLSWTSWDIIQK